MKNAIKFWRRMAMAIMVAKVVLASQNPAFSPAGFCQRSASVLPAQTSLAERPPGLRNTLAFKCAFEGAS